MYFLLNDTKDTNKTNTIFFITRYFYDFRCMFRQLYYCLLLVLRVQVLVSHMTDATVKSPRIRMSSCSSGSSTKYTLDTLKSLQLEGYHSIMTLYKYVSSHWHEKITYCYQFNIYFFIALQGFLINIKLIKYIDFRGKKYDY